ncbi:hypothetical protein M1202_33990, partial [Streptomyces ardesiacus]|nr:hypothetical protein [Streptomyces ardesiacus]
MPGLRHRHRLPAQQPHQEAAAVTARRVTLLLLAAFLLIGTAGQAQAAGYRYWSFWDRDGAGWVYATQ